MKKFYFTSTNTNCRFKNRVFKFLRKEILLNISLIKNTNLALDLVKIIKSALLMNIYTTEQMVETVLKN